MRLFAPEQPLDIVEKIASPCSMCVCVFARARSSLHKIVCALLFGSHYLHFLNGVSVSIDLLRSVMYIICYKHRICCAVYFNERLHIHKR